MRREKTGGIGFQPVLFAKTGWKPILFAKTGWKPIPRYYHVYPRTAAASLAAFAVLSQVNSGSDRPK